MMNCEERIDFLIMDNNFHKHQLKELQQKLPKELKHKKDIPTVIEYQGRRYILDHADNRK